MIRADSIIISKSQLKEPLEKLQKVFYTLTTDEETLKEADEKLVENIDREALADLVGEAICALDFLDSEEFFDSDEYSLKSSIRDLKEAIDVIKDYKVEVISSRGRH